MTDLFARNKRRYEQAEPALQPLLASRNLSPLNDLSSQVFDELFARFNDLPTDVLLLYIIDNVKSSALPVLAEQFHITGNEGWIYASDEQEKRDLIKNAIELHKHKGTKFSLEKVLEILNLNGKITEWFEYGGEPYHFSVILDLNDRGFDSITEGQLMDLIEQAKNVRSVLEKLEVNLTNSATQGVIALAITSEEVTL